MTKRSHSRQKTRRRSTPQISLSDLLRAEIIGIALTALATLTLLSIFSPKQGALTSWWLRTLRQGFGWAAFLMPFILGAAGIAMLMHGLGRPLQIRWTRVAGIGLILLQALALTHLLINGDPAAQARAGHGGGWTGYAWSQFLLRAFGELPTYLLLAILSLIGVALTLERSIGELLILAYRNLRTLWERLSVQQLLRRKSSPSAIPPRPTTRPRPTSTPPVRIIGEPESPPPLPEHPPSLTSTTSVAPHEWQLPDIRQIFSEGEEYEISGEEIRRRAQIIEETLKSFGVPARVVEVNPGPVVTLFGVEPGFIERQGGKRIKVKVSKIQALTDDLALALAASPIRIQAPVPGRPIVGIEVPNPRISLVSLRGILESRAFRELARKTPLPLALGRDVSGQPVVADLIKMPHLLIAGATGSGKSVCVNAIIATLISINTPDRLRLIMVDPKRVELVGYNGIPHLLAPVVVDLERVVGTLTWVTREMDRRYRRFAKVGARNIEDYNRRRTADDGDLLPYILVVIDELADLMMVSPAEVERTICRIAQMARATGIHLVIATQRPSVDVVTGLIKANFPARISFSVTSQVDSRVILDLPGAERLLGSGDMLFMPPDASQPIRVQGSFVSDTDLERLINHWKAQITPPSETPTSPSLSTTPIQPPLFPTDETESPIPDTLSIGEEDPLFQKAVEIVVQTQRASITLLQRKLQIGYTRAARLIDRLEEKGIIGPPEGATQNRKVLIRRPR